MQRYILIIGIFVWIFTNDGKNLTAQDIQDSANIQCRADCSEILNIDKIRFLDIETAGRIALMLNPSIAAAKERINQAQARISQAFSSYLPRLDANLSFSHIRLSDNEYQNSLQAAGTFDLNRRIDDSEDHYNAGLKAGWVLFDGFKRRFSLAAARCGEKESKEALRDIHRLLLSAVSTSYYNAQLAWEKIIISRADKAFNKQKVDEAKARRRMGTGSLSDELNFEVQANAADADLIRAEQEYEVFMFGLAALLGIPNARFPPKLKLAKLEHETEKELLTPMADLLIRYANKYRPDIRQSHFALKRAYSDIGVKSADFYPVIELSAAINGNRVNNGYFEQDDFGSSISANFTYNLFAGGVNRAKLMESKFKAVEYEKNLENLKITVTSEVLKAIAEVKAAQKQLILQRSNAILVKKNRELVEKEYAAGQTSLVRLNEAQRDMVRAKSRLALALVSLRKAWYNLKTSTAQILVPFVDIRY